MTSSTSRPHRRALAAWALVIAAHGSACTTACIRVTAGSDRSTAFRSLDAALAYGVAAESAVIEVCEGDWRIEERVVLDRGQNLELVGTSDRGVRLDVGVRTFVEVADRAQLRLKNLEVTGAHRAILASAGATVRVDDLRFVGNGSAIVSEDAEVLVSGTLFQDNGPAQEGAGVAHYHRGGTGFLQIVSSTFVGNVAEGSGGAVYVAGPAPTFLPDEQDDPVASILSSELIGNEAARGGALSLHNVRFVVDGVRMANNVAEDGGAVELQRSVLFGPLDNNALEENTGRARGGAIHATGSVVVGLRVQRNQAPLGGGLYTAEDSAYATLIGAARVVDNTADEGAGLYVGPGASLVVQDSEILRNRARASGGAAWLEPGSFLESVMASWGLDGDDNLPEDVASTLGSWQFGEVATFVCRGNATCE